MDKAEIIRLGARIGVPFEQTWSCYRGGKSPCGECDSCVLREKGLRKRAWRSGFGEKDMSDVKAQITEIFSSIQGEGIFLGAKQIFVRFKKCNMDCVFCDESKDLAAKEYTPLELARKIRALDVSDGPHHSVSFYRRRTAFILGFS